MGLATRLGALPPLRPLLRDGAAIAAALRPGGIGAAGAWAAMQDLARHRSLTVATRADAASQPVLLTRIHLDGAVQTRVDRAWLQAGPGRALADRHFQAVTAALAGAPAVLAVTRAVSWITGVVLAAYAWLDALASDRDMPTLLSSWRFWLPMLPLALGTCVRLGVRLWLRRRLRRGAR